MPTQTRTEQRRILDAEQANGYADMFWYTAATPPGGETYAAAYPARAIPVIPVAPDPEITRHWAHLLQELFRSAEPGWAFETRLTNGAGLERAGVVWYEWGTEVTADAVCADCGCVERVAHTVVEGCSWLCAECALLFV
jgi:hypothetical protein